MLLSGLDITRATSMPPDMHKYALKPGLRRFMKIKFIAIVYLYACPRQHFSVILLYPEV